VTMEIAFCAKGLAQRTGAMEALYALAHATDVSTARAAFEHVAAPSLNIGETKHLMRGDCCLHRGA
jgi:hypothetical protein